MKVMRAGKISEARIHRRPAGAQAFRGMVAGSDQGTVYSQLARDFGIVERVADQENMGAGHSEAGDEVVTEGQFAVGMDVIQAGDMIEMGGEAEVRDNFQQCLVAIGGEN